ncbi:MAG: hypothetical protein R6U97_02615, partial [Desulfosalsimonas sp.]
MGHARAGSNPAFGTIFIKTNHIVINLQSLNYVCRMCPGRMIGAFLYTTTAWEKAAKMILFYTKAEV